MPPSANGSERLPFDAAGDSSSEGPTRMEEHQAVSGVPVPSDAPRVLVVDDDPAIRLICTTWLTLDGYEVLEAANGQDALDLALTAEPAVVLLDLSMPVLDGFGRRRGAASGRTDSRASRSSSSRGETGPRVTRRVFEMGAAGFFTKPFDPGAVAAFVRSVVGELAGGHGPRPRRRSRRSSRRAAAARRSARSRR